MCWLKAFLRFSTRSIIFVFEDSGKYFATYILPTASPRMLFGTCIALFQRGFCSLIPDIWVLKKSKDAV